MTERDRDADGEGQDRPKPPPRRLALFLVVPLAMLILFGCFTRWRESQAAEETRKRLRDEPVAVQVAEAKKTSDLTATVLPGQTLAFTSADLYARATGYIAERRVDIGSRVKKGDLLIRIAAPDLDQQLAQARAQLGQMEAQLASAHAALDQAIATQNNNRINSQRSHILASEGWDTAQNRDNTATNYQVSVKGVSSAQAGIGVAVANVRAQQATVDRLVALTGFERVLAPFDGVITARDVDVGALVQSDSVSGTPLLHLDQTDVLRCQVYVPQSQFAGIRDGLPARITVPELPGKVFAAAVSRSSAALAQNSRSMLVEVDIDNKDGTLKPGLFVNVGFDIARPAPLIVVPDAALIFDQNGLHVAVVRDGKAHMQPVSIERDTGTEADLSNGLQGGEQVIVNPPTDLTDNQPVRVSPPPKAGS
ncbi:efflux RND transporter periplasmic adaptor subunit [Acetobacteraceae bacterium KSS8]|uniref:Efflux RND transporter periplasmic adaptor subunit n=1 Tax=Endosaccharibacter trunci TaxID=2812733 RepID=A0ABT1W6B4_9PROT|nr:efflux RND transporter periplasmic adaptor subunit [Acetobacteraceae bacterium KSS8]